MNLPYKESSCTGCSACASNCKYKAIEMRKDKNGFLSPFVDEKTCIGCGLCEKVCHVNNKVNKYFPKSFYLFRGEEKERLKSSSGAFFPLIAKTLLARGYYVVGVVFSKDYLSARYTITTSNEIIDSMRKSKYIEADIGNVYKEVKELLQSGEKVFFVGLPCHVAGLLKYVHNHNSLITMDLICFGGGSPEIYKNSLVSFLKKHKINISNIKLVDFRHKPFLDNQHTILDIKTVDSSYTLFAKEFPYYYGFINRLVFRKSCYECLYNRIERCSDITIGDVLGNCDNLGQNVVFVNTDVGEQVLEQLQFGQLEEMTEEEIKMNIQRFCKKKKPSQYDAIMNCSSYRYLEKVYLNDKTKKYIVKKTKRKIKRFLQTAKTIAIRRNTK